MKPKVNQSYKPSVGTCGTSIPVFPVCPRFCVSKITPSNSQIRDFSILQMDHWSLNLFIRKKSQKYCPQWSTFYFLTWRGFEKKTARLHCKNIWQVAKVELNNETGNLQSKSSTMNDPWSLLQIISHEMVNHGDMLFKEDDLHITLGYWACTEYPSTSPWCCEVTLPVFKPNISNPCSTASTAFRYSQV